VDYLRSMFGTNIRAFVPQLAMSGGTMIACACREIVMGKQSSLGPIDPHFGGIPAHGVMEEFQQAIDEASKRPETTPIWQQIVAKYPPAFLGECQKAIAWAAEMTAEWLRTGMFSDDSNSEELIRSIQTELGDHSLTKSHARHLSSARCRDMGLRVTALEDDQSMQEAVLSLHHACMLTFSATPAVKLIENHNGVAFVKVLNQLVVTDARRPSKSEQSDAW